MPDQTNREETLEEVLERTLAAVLLIRSRLDPAHVSTRSQPTAALTLVRRDDGDGEEA